MLRIREFGAGDHTRPTLLKLMSKIGEITLRSLRLSSTRLKYKIFLALFAYPLRPSRLKAFSRGWRNRSELRDVFAND
jgi:hypothetical protein